MLLALGSLTVGGLLLLSALGIGLSPGVAVPLVAVGVGVSILWRQADDDATGALAGGDRHPPAAPARPGPASASRWSSSAAGRSWSARPTWTARPAAWWPRSSSRPGSRW